MRLDALVFGEFLREYSEACSTGEKVARKLELQKSEAGTGSVLTFLFSCTVEVVSHLFEIFPGFFFLGGVSQ